MLKYLRNPAYWSALRPAAVWQSARAWVLANGTWWAASTVGHAVVLSAVLLLLGKVTAPPKEGERAGL